ncbi:tripartite tricarboxylate transporter permease [Bosea caraganae]|uniref:Tripartite tricarboxylate transporter permease n=1 Tax=Bosea caraganae TaxID=2763117 RepID=A0A370LBI4_9HYPH|nr:tripartite tricarboxylate transporter permease [Bosea caraganae]RDJ21703.1 tripartite tricarboxylate transporter permease [Bosea caraganae]RDJ28266.1 tripartite tricarboxylate transporter permease [Bosea caraganae]
MLDNLLLGFSVALSLDNLAYCFIGALLGTLIGILPGLGPAATVALLLPITFTMAPVSCFIMLAGIYYGAQYGGSTTAILLKMPGETSSVVTAIDGHEMAKQGMAGKALATAAIGSFIAGSLSVLLLVFFSPPLAELAINFGAPEYFSVMVLGLIVAVTLASGSVLKALAMVVLGLSLGLVGQDQFSGEFRLTFGLLELSGGLDFVAVTMGLFAVSEVVKNLSDATERGVVTQKLKGLWLNWADFKTIIMPVLRGTGIGSLLGVLPGGGAAIASFVSYSLEKGISKHPERFGKGAIEGVAGPESANNAAAQTSFIPMLTLGIPANPVMALLIAVLIIQGITPGPRVLTTQPTLFWALIASMWIGNLMLVILNLPLIGMWTKLLTLPYRYLFPAIIVFSAIGAYNTDNSVFEVYVLAAFGLLGYVMMLLDCEPAPFLLGFVLGPMLEDHFRRSMLISRGDPTIFLHHPIAATLLAIAAIALVLAVTPAIRRKRDEALQE